MLIFKPETVLRWHRELVRRKWAFQRKAKPLQIRVQLVFFSYDFLHVTISPLPCYFDHIEEMKT